MAYCTKQNMVDRFGLEELIQLTDQANTGVVDDNVLNMAINDASGLIDSYLAGRYSIPLATIPSAINRIACDLTRYWLYDDAVTDLVQKNHDAAISFLKDASNGVVQLGVDATGNKPQTNNSAKMESGGRIFGRNDNGFM